MDVTLVLFKRGGGQKTFVLPREKNLVGRSKECDLRIPVLSVSRRHCELRIDDERLLLHDLGSRNGTFVNGTRVENASLRGGDFLQIGPLLFGIQIDGLPEELEPPDFVILQEVDEQSPEGSTMGHTQEHNIEEISEERLDLLEEQMNENNDSEEQGKN